MSGKTPKRDVELWGEEVYCSMCHKMRPKKDFYIREYKGKKVYDSYCRTCRNIARKRPLSRIPIFSDELPGEIKEREKFVKEHGLLRYPVSMLLEEETRERAINTERAEYDAPKGLSEALYLEDSDISGRRTKPYIGTARVWKVQIIDGKELIHCRKCGRWLPRDAFYRYNTRINPDACKECKKMMNKHYYYKKKGYLNAEAI